MIEIPRNPSRRDLLVFGALLGPFFGFVGWLLFRGFESPVPAWVAWGGGGALLLVFLVVPPARRRIYVGWLLAVFPIGWTISHIVIFVVYYLVVTPVGLLLRLFGKDPMSRAFPSEESTFWTTRKSEAGKGRYFRQF